MWDKLDVLSIRRFQMDADAAVTSIRTGENHAGIFSAAAAEKTAQDIIVG